MNKHDELERRLRSYLADGAKTPAPNGLESRVADSVFKRKNDWILQVVAAAAIVLLAVGLGIGLGKARELANLAGTASPSASPVVMPSTSVKPTPDPSTSEMPVGYPLMPPTSFKMIDESVGWASGSGTDRILRTDDGGAHWKSVEPAGAARGNWTTFFLNRDTAWLASSLQPGSSTSDFSVSIYRTSDGAGSWQKVGTVTPDWGGPWRLDFVDAQHGWLIMKQDGTLESPGIDLVALYGTADGGATWTKLTEASPNPVAGSLPAACSKTDVLFRSSLEGWITGGCGDAGGPFIYATRDGGRTWKTMTLPLPPQASDCSCAIDSLRLSDDLNGILIVDNAYKNAQGYPQNLLFDTADGGRSWRFRAVMPQNAYSAYFVNASYGWTVDAKRDVLFVSTDGGEHWVEGGAIPSMPNVVTVFQPVTTELGWAVGWKSGVETILLTRDGGRSWTPQLSP